MKIAVYGISKNESKFVKRFMTPLVEADMVIIADTGSTDDTVKLLEECGAIVHSIKVDPWRFDIPRNISLSLVPADIDVCVCIDLDEVLTPGWRQAIEDVWTNETTQLRYPYIWNTLTDGKPGTTFYYEKIHVRNGYRWVKPVHEVLQYYGDKPEKQTYCEGFQLFHYPDDKKSRSNYLPLLEMGCKDEPQDDRNSHYLGREYMYYSRWDESIQELQRHLSLPKATWNAERCASMRFISRCYLAKNDLSTAEHWAMKSCIEAPGEREPWLDLGKTYYKIQNWSGLYYAMNQLLNIKEKPKNYICEPSAWNHEPYDYLSLACYHIGLKKEAIEIASIALEMSDDERIRNNIQLMKSELQSSI